MQDCQCQDCREPADERRELSHRAKLPAGILCETRALRIRLTICDEVVNRQCGRAEDTGSRPELHCIAFQRGGAGGLWPKRTSSFPLREVQYINKAVVPIGHHHLASLQFLSNTKAKNFRRAWGPPGLRWVQAVTLSSSGNQQAAPKPLQAPTTKQTEGRTLLGGAFLAIMETDAVANMMQAACFIPSQHAAPASYAASTLKCAVLWCFGFRAESCRIRSRSTGPLKTHTQA